LFYRKLCTLCGALAITSIALTGVAGASSSGSPATVTVRIEGLTKTLLATTKVTTHIGSITKDGTPAGACPATSAAGALDVATHHDWSGDYDSTYGLELVSILGEAHPFTSKDYWEIFVGNVAADAGLCDLSLHRGEQVLFAAVPDSGPDEYPIAVQLPASAKVGKTLTAKVVYYNAKGKATPLANATVTAGKHSYTSNSRGQVKLKAPSAGKLILRATEKNYIRSAPATVQVKK